MIQVEVVENMKCFSNRGIFCHIPIEQEAPLS